MMAWHKDSEVNQAIIRLLDALCTYERNTGRGSRFLLVPEDVSKTIFAMDGKPVSHSPFELGMDLDLIKSKILPTSEKEVKGLNRVKEIMRLAHKLKWFYFPNKTSHPLMQLSEVEKCMLAVYNDFDLNRMRRWVEETHSSEQEVEG